MKNFITLMLFTLLYTSCKAQNTYPLSSFQPKHLKNNNYIKDTENVLNNFVGTWQWTNGTSTFTIKLEKVEHWKMPNDTYYIDMIFGGYKYNENGTLIIDKSIFITEVPNEINAENFAEMQGGVSYPVINELKLIVRDVVKQKSCMAQLKLISGSGAPQAVWHLHDYEHYRSASLGDKPLDFSIPTDLILTKLP